MKKTIKKTVIKKMIEDARASVEVYEVGVGGTVNVDVTFSDATKNTIEITKYIPYEDAASMAYSMAEEIAGEKDGEFIYRPYIEGWISAYSFLRYFTNVDADKIDNELLNKFFLYPNEVWKKIQEIAYNIPQFIDIITNAQKLVEYNNALYINTQSQRIEALAKKQLEILEGVEKMTSVLSVLGENYSDIDKETTAEFVESFNKLMSTDQNEVIEKTASLVMQKREEEEEAQRQEIVASKPTLSEIVETDNEKVQKIIDILDQGLKQKGSETIEQEEQPAKKKRGRKPKKVVETPTDEDNSEQD